MQDTATINSLSLRLDRVTWSGTLPTGLKCVLSAICRHLNDQKGYAYPSIATIARQCSMHARTVQTHIRSLLAMGIVQAARAPGLSVNAYRVNEQALLDRAEMQPDFEAAISAKDAATNGAEVQDFSQNHGDLFQKHEEIATQNGNELKEQEERGDTAPPPPPAFASLPEVQTPTATAPADITPASLDHLNDQRIVNGKGRLRPVDLAQLRTEAAKAGITPQAAVDWLLQSPSRNFFKAEFFRATPAAATTAPAAPTTAAAPVAQPAAAVQRTPEQVEAAAREADKAKLRAVVVIAEMRSSQPTAQAVADSADTLAAAAQHTIVVPAHGPKWARDAVTKALHGEYVSHIALKDACQVLRLCYRTVRAAATATAQAIA
jgi:DNA-binding transcriptional regulator YhcF (GntR family)